MLLSIVVMNRKVVELLENVKIIVLQVYTS